MEWGDSMTWALIVDDDASIRDALQFALRSAGYAIVEVGDGEDAVDVLRATPNRAVVLLDIHMPGMNGSTVLDMLKDDPCLARRHAWIVMSADHDALRRIAREQCADRALAFLKKPFDMEDLLMAVAQQVSRLPPDPL